MPPAKGIDKTQKKKKSREIKNVKKDTVKISSECMAFTVSVVCISN